ncbi:hypothetical protein BH10ACI2_BH10ACI2_05420 [soil metagenome]
MSSPIVTVNSRKYDLSIHRSWECSLIERRGSMLLFHGEFDRDVDHSDLGLIKKGTISYEYYWLDRWYNIFRFHEPDGAFRNFYCNINMPPVFENGILDYVDLDIDVLIWPGEHSKILDEFEYQENALKYGYSVEVRQNVANALSEILEMIKNDELPRGI